MELQTNESNVPALEQFAGKLSGVTPFIPAPEHFYTITVSYTLFHQMN